ncbi:Gfo/Idh/MocA family protein [Bythopirellula goksoeyrii]|uniref:Oxidoreductase YteT n=1 Tax=Bythopirellula goksoeyrii TaxID=1400387 RepID=A0A5B9QBI1_9BACT|nr:Gfo/Idh/MocA family oxidoreductase [Bythopirellula goksoeyrii]QEG36298.1 Putative oxidoreductase YteT precursor [Bythopirellula goksoeyrii]
MMAVASSRRTFVAALSMLAAGAVLTPASFGSTLKGRKLKVVMVGTGIRGTGFWAKRLLEKYSNLVEFVGLCDINPGRLEYAKKFLGLDCDTYADSDFENMLNETKPDLVIVTTTDCTHHKYIISSLELGYDVLTEKPLTTDESKCQQILDAERKSNNNVIVGFNYRWNAYNTKIKQLLSEEVIGKVTSVDFHWYLNTYHGASYFRRWHGLRHVGGTLWVHKATHHFDLMNWWLDSDPEEVFAFGALEKYGSAGPYRGNSCRDCQYTKRCDFYWDITNEKEDMDLYVANEEYDGYVRDNCLFREEINIYDKMSAQVRYKNNVILNYSLTTYSPFEGWRVAFNGTKGRLEARLDIPYDGERTFSQKDLHDLEMNQDGSENVTSEQIIVHQLWEKHDTVKVSLDRTGHGGGDEKLQEKLFQDPDATDPYNRVAGLRDGAMSIMVGIAARKSIERGEPVRIAELIDLEPREKRI